MSCAYGRSNLLRLLQLLCCRSYLEIVNANFLISQEERRRMLVSGSFLLVTVAVILSRTNVGECRRLPRELCTQVGCGWTTCEPIDPSKCDGLVRKKASLCHCCDICVKQLGTLFVGTIARLCPSGASYNIQNRRNGYVLFSSPCRKWWTLRWNTTGRRCAPGCRVQRRLSLWQDGDVPTRGKLSIVTLYARTYRKL